jgi:hypothetical protein
MKLPNWFKIIWWICITAFTGWVFFLRWPKITEGTSAPVDVFIFLVLVALLLAPIFQEVSLFGLKFKQEIEKLKEHVSTQISTFKTDIQNSINNSVNTSVNVSSTPPKDEQLPGIEERIREALRDVLGESTTSEDSMSVTELLSVDDRTQFLFRTRYLIEKNLRGIAESLGLMNERRRPVPIAKLVSYLSNEEIASREIGHAIREVYSVCSPAIHGEEVSDAQFEFVKDVGPEIVRTLEKIRAEQGV